MSFLLNILQNLEFLNEIIGILLRAGLRLLNDCKVQTPLAKDDKMKAFEKETEAGEDATIMSEYDFSFC
ncbi:hypothetical protein G9P44_005396 [Scheffersomyces stipitis]|nr:hypothetical protein G9P44_005396 [Scheffersomyces stipitis]